MTFPRPILARSWVSALPTIWSNCLAGWWLGGGGKVENLPLLFGGATLLYVGGAFLNDAFHRPITSSPVVLGLCRFFLYLLGASMAQDSVSGWSIWCGLAVGAYVSGLGYLAGCESTPRRARYWPAFLLAIPILLALVMNADGYRAPALLLSAVLALWMLRCLRQMLWSKEPDVARTRSGVIAGIVFVDWLAACPVAMTGAGYAVLRELSVAFIALFGLTLLIERLAPER